MGGRQRFLIRPSVCIRAGSCWFSMNLAKAAFDERLQQQGRKRITWA